MIKKLTLKNFKGVGESEVEIEFKPITLLFGPNSAGKSTIIQALHYLKEIFERKNFDPINTQTGGKAIDLGGFRSLVNGHDLKKVIELKLIFEPDIYDIEVGSLSSSVEKNMQEVAKEDDKTYELYDQLASSIIYSTSTFYIKTQIAWHSIINKAYTKEFEFGINDLPLLTITESRNTGSIIYYGISYINFDHPILISVFSEEIINFYKSTFCNIPIETDKLRNVDIEVLNLFSAIPEWEGEFKFKDEFLNSVIWQTENGRDAIRLLDIIKIIINNYGKTLILELKKIRYLGPIREVPPRGFVAHPQAEEDRWANGIAAWDALFNQWVSIKIVNEWLDKLGTGYGVSFKEYFLNTTDIKSDQLKKIFSDRFKDLIEYARTLQSDSENSNRDFELFYYKSILELHEVVNSKNQEQLYNKLNNINNESRDKIKTLIDQQLHLWANIADEIGAIGNDLEGDLTELISVDSKDNDILKRLCIVEKEKQITLEPFDIGIGISQVLPVLVAALMSDKNILSIEQPELHIHPAMQVELADLFISEINKRNMIFLLETHSEHIMLRFLKRIREVNSTNVPVFPLRSDQLNVLYIEQIDGDLFMTSLAIDERGRFKNKWPRGFFEERHGELF